MSGIINNLPKSTTVEKAIDAQYKELNRLRDSNPKKKEIFNRINTLSEVRAKALKFEKSMRS